MMAASQSLFIVGILLVKVDSNIFKLHPDYFADKPGCQDLNNTLYSKISDILKLQNDTIEVVPRIKVDYEIPLIPRPEKPPRNGIFVNISFAFGDDPPFRSYIRKMEESQISIFLNDEHFITKLDPLLAKNKVQIIHFPADESGRNMTFVYIEGIRCKSDGFHNRCWSKPSFCLGWEQFCFEADDVLSLCNNQELNQSITPFESSSLIDSSKLLWAQPEIITVIEHKQTEAEILEEVQYFYDWQCWYFKDLKPRNVTDVLCTTIPLHYSIYSSVVDKSLSVKCLKTAAG